MPDNETIVSESQTQQIAEPKISPEIQMRMDIAMNNGIVPEKYLAQGDEKLVSENVLQENVVEQANTELQKTAETTSVQPLFDVIKEKFQYATPEDAIKEIEQLRALKSSPSTQQEYATEEAKLLHEYLYKGEEDKVLDLLEKRKMVKDFDNKTDEQKLKMYLKHSNPLFDDELIDDEYKKLYTVDENKFKNEFDEIDHLELRKAKLRSQQQIMNDVQKANETFSKFKENLKLNPLPQQQDENYVAWQNMMKDIEEKEAATKESYKKLTPQALQTKVNFNDEASKISFDYLHTPDEEGYKQALEIASDWNNFFKYFNNSDGSLNTQKYAQFVYNGLFTQKIIADAITQGSNARLKSLKPDNSSGNGMRQQIENAPALSELDFKMRRALNGYMPTN